MKRAAGRWLVAALLLLSAGCVKSDWIESTLVTVDVTGTWEGMVFVHLGSGGGPGVAQRAQLELEQEGPKVTGMVVFPVQYSGPLEGRVGGEVFQFRTIGSRSSTVEVTVSGDEMEGLWTRHPVGAVGGGTQRISLRRVPSPPRPPTLSP